MVICLVAEGKNHLTHANAKHTAFPYLFLSNVHFSIPPKNGLQNASLASNLAILGVYVEFSWIFGGSWSAPFPPKVYRQTNQEWLKPPYSVYQRCVTPQWRFGWAFLSRFMTWSWQAFIFFLINGGIDINMTRRYNPWNEPKRPWKQAGPPKGSQIFFLTMDFQRCQIKQTSHPWVNVIMRH